MSSDVFVGGCSQVKEYLRELPYGYQSLVDGKLVDIDCRGGKVVRVQGPRLSQGQHSICRQGDRFGDVQGRLGLPTSRKTKGYNQYITWVRPKQRLTLRFIGGNHPGRPEMPLYDVTLE